MFDRFENVLESMGGKNSNMLISDSETMGSVRYLMNIFLSRNIYGSISFITIPIRNLQGECRLTNTRLSGEEDETSRCESLAENCIEFIAAQLDLGNSFS